MSQKTIRSPTVEALLKAPGTQRHSVWRALSAFCAALTADTPAAYNTVILIEAQHPTALSYPQRFTVIPRPLCFYDGGERANWTYDKSDLGHFDYKACGKAGMVGFNQSCDRFAITLGMAGLPSTAGSSLSLSRCNITVTRSEISGDWIIPGPGVRYSDRAV
ncbi:hypothetical protein B0H11DRAFT_2218212 [Mycena galericulata]|nr:hypothetical protein B0H11DRAFT_2218212 [Mycena galericulata]